MSVSKIGNAPEFIEVFKSKRIVHCSYDEIKQPLRKIMIKLGLRPQNIPNELETQVLVEHIMQHFGGNYLSEITLAFELALARKLDLSEDGLNCYESFSCLYFSKIMNSYRTWAQDKYRELEKHIEPGDEKKYIADVRDIPWGKIIQHEYSHFLSFGEERIKLFPGEMYDQLVKDEMIAPNLFRELMPGVRAKMIGKEQTELSKLAVQVQSMADASLRKKNIFETNRHEHQLRSEELKNGKKDGEIEGAAKRYAILLLFREAKKLGKDAIYRKH